MMEETDESQFRQLPSNDPAPKIGYSPEDILTQYKYNSSPRGCAIIIRWSFPEFPSCNKSLTQPWFILLLSNEDFPASSSYRPRRGDEADVENLKEFFEIFGLEVSVLKNVSKADMLEALEQFRETFL